MLMSGTGVLQSMGSQRVGQTSDWTELEEWEDCSNYFGEGAGISRIWAAAHAFAFNSVWTVRAPLAVSFHLLIEDGGPVLSANLVPFCSNQFMLRPWAMSFFQKLCPAPFPPVTNSGILWLRFFRNLPEATVQGDTKVHLWGLPLTGGFSGLMKCRKKIGRPLFTCI